MDYRSVMVRDIVRFINIKHFISFSAKIYNLILSVFETK